MMSIFLVSVKCTINFCIYASCFLVFYANKLELGKIIALNFCSVCCFTK